MLCCFSCFEAWLLLLSRECGIFPPFSSANSAVTLYPDFYLSSLVMRGALLQSWDLEVGLCAFMYLWQHAESVWDGGNFLQSIPGFGCHWSVGNTAVLVIAEQCTMSGLAFSCSAPLSEQKAWREHSLHTWHWLDSRDIPRHMMSEIKAEERAFLGGVGATATGLPVGAHGWLPLLFSSSFLHTLNYLYLNPWVFSFCSFCSPTPPG